MLGIRGLSECHRAAQLLLHQQSRNAGSTPLCLTRSLCYGVARLAWSSAAQIAKGACFALTTRGAELTAESATRLPETCIIVPFHAAHQCGGVAPFSTSLPSSHGQARKPPPGEGLKVTFVDSDGNETPVRAYEGDSLLDIAHANDVDLEGACEGSLACSTCHVIVDQEFYDKLEEPSDEENDMLDLAFGLTETSRLGCQVVMSKDIDGIRVTLPSATRNMQVDKQPVNARSAGAVETNA